MAALYFLVAGAVAASAQGRPASSELYALNAVSPAELGRFFDAAARHPWTPPEAAEAVVVAPASRPAPRPAARPPFVVPIPDVPPPSFNRVFRRLLKRPETGRYDAAIEAQAQARGLDPRLVKSIIAAESEFSARARSSAGAVGLMQVEPETAGYMGVKDRSLFDPIANIEAGTAYLAYLFKRAWARYHLRGLPFSRAPQWLVQRVIAAYNAGPRFLNYRRLYRQTRDYVFKVLLYYRSPVSDLRR